MNLKPKTVRRLLLLSLVSVLLVGSIFSLFVVRRWQNQRLLEVHRTEGLAAYEAGDYFNALEKTSFYYRRGHVDDAEVLLTVAESRRRLEEPDGRHLVQSIRPYRLYLELQPDDVEVKRTLLDVYNQAGYFIEARDMAERMRPADLSEAQLEHVPVLRAEALALVGARAFGERLEKVLDRIFELAPLDLEAHLAKFEVWAQGDQRAEARAWGDKVLDAHPDDPRAGVIYAVSRLVHPMQAEIIEARVTLCRAVGLDPETAQRIEPGVYPDAQYASRVVSLLERVRSFAHAKQVLIEAAPRFDDVELRRALARRLWQDNADEEVVKLTTALDPQRRDADSELLGFRAAALARLGKPDEAKAIAERLAEREGDYRAEGWAGAIQVAAAGEKIAVLEAINTLREATKVHPHEPVIKAMLGDRLAMIGRMDEARRAWRDSTEMQNGSTWALPLVRIAESLLPEGRADEAAAAANEAQVIASDRILVNVVWFEAQAARIQNGSVGDPGPAAVLDRLQQVLSRLDEFHQSEAADQLRERLLPCKVILLARMGRPDEARKAALSGASGPLHAQTLQQLAAISVSEGLGLEDQLMQRADAVVGGGLAVAQARALKLASDGDVEYGLTLLREAAGSAPGIDAQIAIARYMDSAGHPDALAEWRRIGDENPDKLIAQRACLGARTVAADGDFVTRTIERYRRLQGKDEESDDAVARIARARVLLHGRPTRRQRDEAVGILASVVNANPRASEPRVLLAAALAHSDPSRSIAPDLARATHQLAEAARLEPRNAGIALELARLLRAQGDDVRAIEHLHRVARHEQLEWSSRWRAAEMLLATGDASTALDVLAALADRLADETPGALLATLAEAHAAARQPDRAGEIYERLADGAADDGRSVLATAVYLARQGDRERAMQMLGRLDELSMPSGEHNYLLARFEASAGSPQAAAERYEAAVDEMPYRADIWRQYASMHLERGDVAAALEVAARGLNALPGDAGLGVLQERARLASADGEDEPSLRPLVDMLRTDPRHVETARIFAAIEEAREQGQLDSVSGLMRLADRFSASAPLQMYIAQRLAQMDRAAAAQVAWGAMNIDPTDPEPAKLAAQLFLALGQWNEMLTAAQAWRQRDQGGSPEADVAVAEAQWRLGRLDQALRILSPRLADAVNAPGDPVSLSVLNLHATILVLSGREGEARARLAPLLPQSAGLRSQVWMSIAARHIMSLSAAREWLNEVEGHLPADAADEHLAGAIALTVLADRFPDDGERLRDEAAARLSELVKTPQLESAGAWEALGVLRHRAGDIEAAEESYHRALEIDPRRPISLNNLATIVAQMRGDPEAALGLAQRAVSASGMPDPGHLMTLAAVHREIASRRAQRGDRAGAIESYRAAAAAFGRVSSLTPMEPAPLVEQAQLLLAAGDDHGAAVVYERLLQLRTVPAEILPLVRNNLAAALRASAAQAADLERARRLVLDALRTVDRAAFYDTLGWIELDMGRPDEAREAFRLAMERSQAEGQKLPTAAIGLAYTLKDGGPDQRREASRLVVGMEDDIDERYRARLDEVRAALTDDGGS